MCRFVGFILKSAQQEFLSSTYHLENLKKMRDVLRNGGPDDYGQYHFENVYLGHRRLSIIDTSTAGRQPFKSICGRWILIYNGEVYNFQSIRDQLVAQGHIFQGNSDTEVVLNAWKQWGPACLSYFVGMFSFVVLDEHEKKLHLVRDRVGVKPLYIFQNEEIFAFASEPKAFHALPQFSLVVNPVARKLFFQLGYIPAPHSIRDGVFQLEPGCCLRINIKNPKQTHMLRYWDVRSFYTKSKYNISWEEAVNELNILLDQACSLRLVSDVPLGIFLSGGVDSTAVLSSIAKKTRNSLKTFTVGFNDAEFDEAPYARAVAKFWKTDHHEFTVYKNDCLEVMSELPWIWDEPFGDSSQIPTLLLSRFARKHVKVALSADGGDETFYGYPKYRLTEKRHQIINTLRTPLRILGKIGRRNLRQIGYLCGQKDRLGKAVDSACQGGDILETLNIGDEVFAPDEIASLFNEERTFPRFSSSFEMEPYKVKDPVDRMLACDYRTYLPDDILVKMDRATMSTGLEGREPLLDHRLIEFAARLPKRFKRDKKYDKILLRKVLWSKIDKKLVERKKMGFGVPLENWIRQDAALTSELNETCNTKNLKDCGFLNPSKTRNYINNYLNYCKDFRRAWLIYSWTKWHNRWLA